MRASLAGCALAALIGCAPPGPPPRAANPADARAACARYEGVGDAAFAFCLQGQAPGMADPAALAELCDPLGDAARACRTAWVDARIDDPRASADLLLAGCGAHPDCAFRVLDTHARGSLDDQVAACERLTGRLVDDCVSHALVRWFDGAPGAEEAALLHAAPTRYPARVGETLGRLAACRQVGACGDGTGTKDVACRRERDALATDPRRCGR